MLVLSSDTIARLLEPYVGTAALPAAIYQQLSLYLELILKWNARVNLTAIRDPEEIVRRHFGESLFVGLHLRAPGDQNLADSEPRITHNSLLDLGSGAGFPGVPIQLLYPELSVTLAESRSRKAAFLREVIRVLELNTEVWTGRAEAMPADRRFLTVTLRAVDAMDAAVAEGGRRALSCVLILGTRNARYPTLPSLFHLEKPVLLPHSNEIALWIAKVIPTAPPR